MYLNKLTMQIEPITPRIVRRIIDPSFGSNGKNLRHKKHPLIIPKPKPETIQVR